MLFLFYSHDGLGLGHVRRHLAIASALVSLDPDVRILVVTSIDEVSRLGLPPNVDILKLPGLRKVANSQYASRRLGLDGSGIHMLRANLLSGAVAGFAPDVVLVDKHPLGVGSELREALVAAQESGARIVLGLRDILDDPGTVLQEWVKEELHEAVARIYDEILIYGERSIFDPVKQYCFSKELARRTRFCGYVLNQTGQSTSDLPMHSIPVTMPGRPVVLGTAGGGEDGFELLREFIQAASGASWQGVAVTGPMLAETQVQVLRNLAIAAKVQLCTFIPSLPDIFKRIDALVSMGGYNTLLEAVASGVPTVCVPRVQPRSEQLLRAQRFAKLGLLRMVHPDQLEVETLRREISYALGISRTKVLERARTALKFNGASRAAQYLLGKRIDQASDRALRVPQFRAA